MTTTYKLDTTRRLFWTITTADGVENCFDAFMTDEELIITMKQICRPMTVTGVDGFLVSSVWQGFETRLAVFPTIEEAQKAIDAVEADERDSYYGMNERCLRGE